MNRRNPAKENFLRKFPNTLIENQLDKFNRNIYFSFQYFDNSQEAGQGFCDWSRDQLDRLLNKLKHYSGNTMGYWKNQRVGGGGLKVLELYKSFPVHSDFIHPKHVPLDVKWARFRLESDMRLIGFVVPNDLVLLHKIPSNIFNVVFLDQHHRFYKAEEK